MKYTSALLFLLVMISALLAGCGDTYIPKPHGYYRIELPEKSYISYQTPCDVKFDVPNYAKLEMLKENAGGDSCWFNLSFPKLNAKLHCTYVSINDNFEVLIRDAYGFAAKHEMKASALKRTQINYPDKKIHGILYDIEGDAASQLQFFLSDSTNNFFRGSLYFFNSPNPDSIAPVLSFIREDIIRLTQTLEWSDASASKPANK